MLYLLQENALLVMIVGLAGAGLTWGLAVARVTITVMDHQPRQAPEAPSAD